jgi:two-component system response regulator HydG
MKVYAFPEGLPSGLQHAGFNEYNFPNDFISYQSENGKQYVHIAVPILSDGAKRLHVGLNENKLFPTIYEAWLLPILISVLVITLALSVAFFLFRRLTLPLRRLAQEAAKIDPNDPTINCPTGASGEVKTITVAFTNIIGQLKGVSRRLENLSVELDVANRQMTNAFKIVRTVGSHVTLREVCGHLVDQLSQIVTCGRLAILMLDRARNHYFIYINDRLDGVPAEEMTRLGECLAEIDTVTFVKTDAVRLPSVAKPLQAANQLGIFPIHFENQPVGALMVGCPKGCHCYTRQLEVVKLILQECSGAVHRAIHYTADLNTIQCQIGHQSQFCGIVGKDRRMQTVFKLINDIAPTDAAVLIQGESGTGKELVARAIHERSLRKQKPFVVINCSAYPTSLLESELFGHEEGAFTGAIRQKRGRFEQADGGTVFLDEIGEIAPSAQINLLRVLQTQTFERIGGEKTLHVQVRVIAATNKDLLSEVKKGNFREDLYYRLNEIPIYLPPLRKRCNDVPLLARHFLDQFKREQGKAVNDFSTETMRRLLEHAWPGNVRELENTVEHALVLTKGDTIEVAALPSNVRMKDVSDPDSAANTMVENERRLFKQMLEETGWNKKLAAKRLGISRSTLYNKIKKYQLTPPTIH